jgi:hypothetical protein
VLPGADIFACIHGDSFTAWRLGAGGRVVRRHFVHEERVTVSNCTQREVASQIRAACRGFPVPLVMCDCFCTQLASGPLDLQTSGPPPGGAPLWRLAIGATGRLVTPGANRPSLFNTACAGTLRRIARPSCVLYQLASFPAAAAPLLHGFSASPFIVLAKQIEFTDSPPMASPSPSCASFQERGRSLNDPHEQEVTVVAPCSAAFAVSLMNPARIDPEPSGLCKLTVPSRQPAFAVSTNTVRGLLPLAPETMSQGQSASAFGRPTLDFSCHSSRSPLLTQSTDDVVAVVLPWQAGQGSQMLPLFQEPRSLQSRRIRLSSLPSAARKRPYASSA